MDNTQLVDLLLVRLARQEEKDKVLELLVSEMGMTREEAMEKIENSPNILSEGIPMEQARILQNRLYPYVDLLPRFYASEPESKFHKEEAEAALEKKEEPAILDEMQDSTINEDDYEFDSDPYGLQTSEDESVEVTTAADEMLSIERCHICGSSPTSVQKLVPCRTCGDLTCANCFNRSKHICEKCVLEGKTVDRPLDGVPEYNKENASEADVQQDAGRIERTRISSKRGSNKISPVLIAVVGVILLATAFYFIDPMNMFSNEGTNIVLPDTTSINPDTAEIVINPDTVGQQVPDTLAFNPDSLITDSIPEAPFRSLRDLVLPDNIEVPDVDIVTPRLLYSTPVSGIEIQSDSLPFLSYPVGYLAAAASLELDAICLIRTEGDFDILIIAILHPEPVERRTAFLSHLGSLLDSTMVDQMVLYYRENQYYEPNLFSFIADSFNVISQSTSPYFLQRKQASIPETSAILSGSIFEWMTNLN